MSSPPPDYRKDIGAFIRMAYGEELSLSEHHTAFMQSILNAAAHSRQKKDYREEVFTGFDPGTPAGDQTAYVRYTYDGHTIHIDELSTEDVYDYDSHTHYRGERPTIAQLLERVGKKPCKCDAGLVQVGDFETGRAITMVCTRCDGFSTQRHRPIRPRARR